MSYIHRQSKQKSFKRVSQTVQKSNAAENKLFGHILLKERDSIIELMQQ